MPSTSSMAASKRSPGGSRREEIDNAGHPGPMAYTRAIRVDQLNPGSRIQLAPGGPIETVLSIGPGLGGFDSSGPAGELIHNAFGKSDTVIIVD